MKIHRNAPIVLAVIILTLSVLACSVGTAAEPTPTVLPPTSTSTPEPVSTPTNTSRPTWTPKPTATPNVAATQQYDEFSTLLKTYEENGYVSTTEGDIYSIDPFKEEWAQIGWYQWWPFNDNISDFVFKAHFNWSTASDTPDESGCGFVFGIQENGDHYSVFLDKSRILFMMKRGTYAYMVGKTRGPGRTNFGNPAEADFVLSVKGQSAFVSVDGEVTEYTLSADQTSAGDYGLTLLSGTNSGYGTRCEMNDILMWTAK